MFSEVFRVYWAAEVRPGVTQLSLEQQTAVPVRSVRSRAFPVLRSGRSGLSSAGVLRVAAPVRYRSGPGAGPVRSTGKGGPPAALQIGAGHVCRLRSDAIRCDERSHDAQVGHAFVTEDFLFPPFESAVSNLFTVLI